MGQVMIIEYGSSRLPCVMISHAILLILGKHQTGITCIVTFTILIYTGSNMTRGMYIVMIYVTFIVSL